VEPHYRDTTNRHRGRRRCLFQKWAKTALPIAAAIYALNGLVGEYSHPGVARKPGGFKLASYNLPMGPPISAPA